MTKQQEKTTSHNMKTTDQDQQKSIIVSFIVPYHNEPTDMLRNCLDSICALTLRPYEREIIVVDDGSEQSPLNDLTDILDSITYIRQQNSGLSVARNTGLKMASGQYIQFVDADDHLIATQYEHCLDIVRFQKPDMVVFDFTRENVKNTTYNDQETVSGAEYLAHRNIRGTACGYLFKKIILGSLRFTPDIYHEDEEFTPQLMLRAETVCATDAKAYYYNQRQNSITTETSIRQRLKRLNDKKGIIMRLHQLTDQMTPLNRQALQRRVAQLTMDYIYDIIVETKSKKYMRHRLEELRRHGLFPLPDRNYTKKYKWFRHMINSRTGQQVLLHLLPLLKKER